MTSAAEHISELLESTRFNGDLLPFVEWLCDLTETDRPSCFLRVQDRIVNAPKLTYEAIPLLLAAYATAPTAMDALIPKLGFRMWPSMADAALAVLISRNPSWLSQFSELALEHDLETLWPVVHGLARARLVPFPHSESYVEGILASAPIVLTADQIRSRLLSDPAATEANLLRLMALPRTGESMWHHDNWQKSPLYGREKTDPQAIWAIQVARLCDEGLVSTDALFSTLLSRLTGEPSRLDVIWFVGLAKRLRPSPAAVSGLRHDLLRFLRAEPSTLVGLAQRELSRLVVDQVDPSELLAASVSPLQRPEKRLVLAQLALLGKLLSAHPGFREQVVAVVMPALGHERVDVQAAALDFVNKYSGGTADLASSVEGFAPSLLVSLLGDSPAAAGQARDVTDELHVLAGRIQALDARTKEELRLDLALAAARDGLVIDPVPVSPALGALAPPIPTDPVEVAALLSAAIERFDSWLEVERCLAAAVLTAAIPLSERSRIAGPLARRADQLKSYSAHGLVAWVAHSWCTGAYLKNTVVNWEKTPTGRKFVDMTQTADPVAPTRIDEVFTLRVIECTQVIARGVGAELLASPSHISGGISADELRRRLARDNHNGYNAVDTEVAALRLERGLDATFWDELAETDHGYSNALQRFYQQQAVPVLTPVVGVPAGLYPMFSNEKPVIVASCSPAQGDPGVWRVLNDLADPLADHPWLTSNYERIDGIVLMWSSIAPWHRDLVCAHLLRPLSKAMYPGLNGGRGALECLGEPFSEFGPIAHLAMTVGLMGLSGDVRTMASDVFAEAATDGRLEPQQAAEALCVLADGGLLKMRRLIDALTGPAQLAVVGYRLAQVFALAAPGLIERGVRDLHLMLEMWTELVVRFGVDLVPDDIRSVASRKGAGRLVTEARRLTALTSTGPERTIAAVQAAAGLLRRTC